jgi:hypothetical protein
MDHKRNIRNKRNYRNDAGITRTSAESSLIGERKALAGLRFSRDAQADVAAKTWD